MLDDVDFKNGREGKGCGSEVGLNGIEYCFRSTQSNFNILWILTNVDFVEPEIELQPLRV